MLIIFIGGILCVIVCILQKIHDDNLEKKRHRELIDCIYNHPLQPFSIAQYFERMESAYLDILQNQKPVDQTIILWCGLDGLTISGEGELEWISRKKPEEQKEDQKEDQKEEHTLYAPCSGGAGGSGGGAFCGAMQYTYPTYSAFGAGMINSNPFYNTQCQNTAYQIQMAQQVQNQNWIQQLNLSCFNSPIPYPSYMSAQYQQPYYYQQ